MPSGLNTLSSNPSLGWLVSERDGCCRHPVGVVSTSGLWPDCHAQCRRFDKGLGPVADGDGGSPFGVGVETAVPAPEHRLALAVRVSVSAARAGLGRALRRDGDGGNAEFGASSRRSLPTWPALSVLNSITAGNGLFRHKLPGPPIRSGQFRLLPERRSYAGLCSSYRA